MGLELPDRLVLAECKGHWLAVDAPCAAPFTVLNCFSTNQPEQGARFNATSAWFDLGVDHPLAVGQVFFQHLVWIHPSHKHAAAELFGDETRPRLGEVDQVSQRRFQACCEAEGYCRS